MSNLLITYNNASTLEDQDDILKVALRQIFDLEQKKEWQKTLEAEYSIKKGVDRNSSIKRPLSYIRLVAIAASIAVLITVGKLYLGTTVSPHDLASEYLHATVIYHPGVQKGLVNEDQQNQIQAIQLFNNQEYEAAIVKYSNITSPTKEDQYYLSLSYLFSGQTATSLEKLNAISSSEIFSEEIHWYKSLAYVISGQYQTAEIELLKIKSGDWNYEKAQKLLSAVRK